MRMNYCITLLLFLNFININIHSELLIFKKNKTSNYLEPLTKNESITYGPLICELLLKYQWPASIASNLTQNEINELLTANRPYAEEQFIEKKLKYLIPDIDFTIIFIPTSIYELFAIVEFFTAHKHTQPLNVFMQSEILTDRMIKGNLSSLDKNIEKLLNIPLSKEIKSIDILKKIFDNYSVFNQLFYNPFQQTLEIPVLNLHLRIINFLLSLNPDFLNVSTRDELTQKIANNIDPILLQLVEKFSQVYNRRFLNDTHGHTSQLNISVISQVIALEYEAHKSNKMLLFRGSKLIEAPIGKGKSAEVIGHTIHAKAKIPTIPQSSLTSTMPQRNVKNYNKNLPFTMSFGASLFAGYINNQGGCAYSYLTMPNMVSQNFSGYALFINKKDQYEHNSSNLFFIPNLTSIAALFQYGYLFHPRSKAAVLSKQNPIQNILGAPGVLFQDPAGILILTRDPLKQTTLFSDFLINNSALIEINQTYNKESRESKIFQAQNQTKIFFKALETLQRRVASKSKGLQIKKS